MVQSLPITHKVLGSIPNTAKKRKRMLLNALEFHDLLINQNFTQYPQIMEPLYFTSVFCLVMVHGFLVVMSVSVHILPPVSFMKAQVPLGQSEPAGLGHMYCVFPLKT